MCARSKDPVPGEPERSPSPPLSSDQAHELVALAARLQEWAPARPNRPRLTSEEASAKARAYWATLGPIEKCVRALALWISTSKATERELADLLQQLQAQQPGDAVEGAL